MGDAEKADRDLVPPVYGTENPEWFLPEDRLDYACNYQLINDNLTDLGHLAWVHSQSFGADETWTATIPKVSPLARGVRIDRSEEHTSELQSLMRISYAVFCLKKKNKN